MAGTWIRILSNLKPLARIADRHPSAKMRALAVVSQLRIATEHSDAIRANMNSSQPVLVRHIVETEMAHYGACMRMIGAGR